MPSRSRAAAMSSPSSRHPLITILREVAVPLAGLAMVAILDHRQAGGYLRRGDLDKVVAVAYLLLGFSLAYRLFCTVVLDLIVAGAKGRPVPRILKHMIGIAVALAALLLSANVLFSGAFTSLLTLSSVIAVVIGLALRPIILDVFSGLSANLDSAFHIGDWIEIARRGGGSTQTGWVEQINWRTTHLRTRSGNLVICPNSTLSTAIITNFSRPTHLSRFDLKVKLPPELDPDRARQVLSAAVRATLGRADGPAAEKQPDVLITNMEASGVQYWIRFWLSPAESSADAVIDTVAHSVLRHLQLAGIPLSEKVVLHREKRAMLDTGTAAARAEVFGQLPLFHGVPGVTIERVAEAAAPFRFAEGETLIRQGDEDNDMFLLVEGAVNVLVTVDGKELHVASMQAGDYFGEMSLLTGEPRTATIRAATSGASYRISRESIAPLIETDLELMHLLSRNLAERNLRRQEKTAASVQGSHEEKQSSLAVAFLGKMRSIFRSGRAA
jgi:small-conductance mechanosensitive channel/CRP-like cAMP-binding protein